jgi:hypothetical protein
MQGIAAIHVLSLLVTMGWTPNEPQIRLNGRTLMSGLDELDRPGLLHIQPDAVSMHLKKIKTNI